MLSLDALRGLTMLSIVGGADALLALVTCLTSSTAVIDALRRQLDHPNWEGFVLWDAIMPLFLFVVGAAMPLAISKRREQGQPLGPLYWRIARRVAVLWILGIVVQHFAVSRQLAGPGSVQQAGVVEQQYAAGHCRRLFGDFSGPAAPSIRGHIALFAALLLGYWGLLVLVPLCRLPGGNLGGNGQFPPLHRSVHFGEFPPGALFHLDRQQLGAFRVGLVGGFGACSWRRPMDGGPPAGRVDAAGLGCLAGGWIWSYWLPLNRHLWTSSMILWASGWGFLLLALFYVVVDVWQMKRWASFFIVIGANALLVYALAPVVELLLSAGEGPLSPKSVSLYADVAIPLVEVTLLWLL